MLQVVACPRKISDTRNKAGHNQNLEPRTVEFWLDQSTQMCNKGEKMLIMLAIKWHCCLLCRNSVAKAADSPQTRNLRTISDFFFFFFLPSTSKWYLNPHDLSLLSLRPIPCHLSSWPLPWWRTSTWSTCTIKKVLSLVTCFRWPPSKPIDSQLSFQRSAIPRAHPQNSQQLPVAFRVELTPPA